MGLVRELIKEPMEFDRAILFISFFVICPFSRAHGDSRYIRKKRGTGRPLPGERLGRGVGGSTLFFNACEALSCL